MSIEIQNKDEMLDIVAGLVYRGVNFTVKKESGMYIITVK